MIIGHLPAGYLWTRLFLRMTNGKTSSPAEHAVEIGVGTVAAILPDIDMFYFYLVDGRQHGHHTYWTHLPIFWLCVMAGWFVFAWLAKKPRIAYLGAVAGTNLLLHLLLDTFAGRVWWFYPFCQRYFNLIPIPNRYGWWLPNFVFHWTFLADICLILIAAFVLLRSRWAVRKSTKKFSEEVSQ